MHIGKNPIGTDQFIGKRKQDGEKSEYYISSKQHRRKNIYA